MNRRIIFVLLFISITVTTTHSVQAQETDGQQKTLPWYETIIINGFVSSGYSYNFNKPDGMKNQFRVFDIDDNSMKVDVLELSVKKDATVPGEAGFRFDIVTGSSIPKISRSNGLNSGDLDLQQMYIGYLAPIGSGIRLDAGKFITHMGYELIEGYDGYNDNASRSFLFGYAIPFTHTGIRAAYQIVDPLSLTLMLTNGWDNAIDNNAAKTICLQVGITPMSGMNLFINGIYGPERNGENNDIRRGIDIVGTYTMNELLTLGVNGNFSSEQNAVVTGDASWNGVVGYLRVNCMENFSCTLRAEQFDDHDGTRTGVVQKLSEFTFTPEFRPAPHLILRGDFRLDTSDKEVFEKEMNTLKDQQTTLSVNILYLF